MAAAFLVGQELGGTHSCHLLTGSTGCWGGPVVLGFLPSARFGTLSLHHPEVGAHLGTSGHPYLLWRQSCAARVSR